MVKINWSSQATKDLKAIAEYFDSTSHEYAKYLVGNLFSAVADLEKFPEMGRLVPELNSQNFQERIVDGYRIIFLKTKSEIEILTIVHSRQDLIHHLKKPK